jgi:PAS domain S-box-containing protein
MTSQSKTGSDGVEAVWRTRQSDLGRSSEELAALVRRLEVDRIELEQQNDELRHSQQALLRRLEFEEFIFDLSRTFIGLTEEEVDVNMERGLARVGEFMEMDRVTLLELSRDRTEMAVAYSWSSHGSTIPPPVITKSAQPWWVGQVLRGEVSLTSHVDDLPEEAAAEKAYLRQRGIASAASIPLKVSGEIAGVISFVTLRRHVAWTDELVNELRAIGDILWNALKRRQAMQALRAAQGFLRESEERFRLVANAAPVLIWMAGVDKRCTYFNQGWLEFTGRSLDAELGHGWTQGIHADDLEKCLNAYTKAFDSREPFEMEYRLRRHDGEYRWIYDQGAPRFNADASFAGYIGSCIDVTERKLAAEALSTVSQRLIQAHEEERTRLARELHDDIIQRLAMLSVNLQRVRRRPAALIAEVDQEIGNAIQRVADLATDLQTLSHRLHSSKLELLGLAGAAASFCDELSDRQSVDIDFHSENISKTLPMEISLCLFRVLQEALQNAIKHSGARHFQVVFHGQAEAVELCVQDSGAGFDPQEAMRGRGLGLTSMKERLALVHGQLSIHSELGRGTTIQARVPLRSQGSPQDHPN